MSDPSKSLTLKRSLLCSSILLAIHSPTILAQQDDLEEIIYLDNFGNAMTGLRAKNVPVHSEMIVNDRRLVRSRTFSDKPEGSAFWYENSSGLVEFAVNQGDAKTVLGIDVGSKFAIDMSPDHS